MDLDITETIARAGEASADDNPETIEGLTLDIEKRVGHRLHTLVTDPQLLQIHQQFGGHVFRRSSIYHGLALFLQQHNIRGRRCFEIGTWNGLTALILARHFDRVITCDISHNGIKRDIAAAVGVTNIDFIDIADNKEKAQLAERIKFDFAYIDGNHAEDTYTDFALVKRCGRVLFHEAWPFQPPVWNLLNAMPKQQVCRGGVGLALWDERLAEHERGLNN